jgi:type IV pilus assembly protein PilA
MNRTTTICVLLGETATLAIRSGLFKFKDATMRLAQPSHRNRQSFFRRAVAASIFLMLCAAAHAQNTKHPAAPPLPEMPWRQDLNNYPGLPAEFAQLFEKLKQNVQFPAARNESHLLPLLPQLTLSIFAIPNYGDTLSQAVKTFRRELQDSSVLRDWWAHGQMAKNGPELLDSLDKLSELHQYLGNEIVVSAAMNGKEPAFLLVSEVRKPGLKEFLQTAANEHAGKSDISLRIVNAQELATAKDKPGPQSVTVLLRPDFVIAGSDLATLRSFNDHLESSDRSFVSSPFGQRVVKEYRNNVTLLGAADLQKILAQSSPATKQSAALQKSGFADVQYLTWEHATPHGTGVSQMELSFTRPRQGPAAWLAKPVNLGSLNFVSPKAVMAATIVLSNPSQIFDDVKNISGPGGAKSYAAIPGVEQAMGLKLKDDFLDLLRGEVTIELDSVTPPQPIWKAMLAANDTKHLEQTLATLLLHAPFHTEKVDKSGVTYYTMRIPSGKTTTNVALSFVDGYMLLGSSREAVAEAVQIHRSGESLAKSKTFLASLPAGHSLEASALLYQDSFAMTALRLRAAMPDLAEILTQNSREAIPTTICLYGDDAAIREASSSSGVDLGSVLVAAAIAIPNLLRSKIAANEASAVGSVRTVNTAQVTYSATFPKRGFAPNLASLGLNPQRPNAYSPEHAGLLDQSLANDTCKGDAWCTKSGFQFRVNAPCKLQVCKDYVVLATPISAKTGTRNFCSTSDGLIRFKLGNPITTPFTWSECKSWPPL